MTTNKFTISLDEYTAEIINGLANKSGMPAAAIIRNLLTLNHTDIHFFSIWFNRLEKGTEQYVRGRQTLMHPGPATLLKDIAQIEAACGNKLLIGAEALVVDPYCDGVYVVKRDSNDKARGAQ